MGAQGYYECSALTGEGVEVLFESAIRAVLSPPQIPNKKKRRLGVTVIFVTNN